MAKPLVDQDERCLVPGARREADNPLQREDADAEMHDTLTERLVRGVRTMFFLDVSLFLRQVAGNPRGEFRAQLVDGELAPGQHVVDLGAGQLHRLGQTHVEFA